VSDLAHRVERALRAAGDPDLVHIWRRTCRELASGPRAAVVAGTSAAATAALAATGGLGALALGLDPGGDPLPSAIRDVLLGVHAIVWVTSATQPLGAGERSGIAAVDAALPGGAAGERIVFVQGAALLARVSDDPDTERAEIQARLAALLPAGWRVAFDDTDELAAALGRVRADHAAATTSGRAAAAALLLDDAAAIVRRGLDDARAAVDRANVALSDEDASLDQARSEGRRAATFTLAVARRHTQSLRVDLRAFLISLEADLPAQIAAVPDDDRARRALPHWIEHVISEQLEALIDAWRAAVVADVDRMPASDRALAHAELLLPSVHPPPFPTEGRWRRAVGLTAGVGGAAVLAALQLWVPAAIAAGAGVAWSVFDREPTTARRDRLLELARAAVREIGSSTDRVLEDQLAAMGAALEGLADAEAARVAAERAEVREALRARLRLHVARREQAEATLAAFQEQRSGL
jgi:hypothetical protein